MTFFNMAVVIDQQSHSAFKRFSRPQHRCRLQSFTQLDFSKLEELSQPNHNLANSLKRTVEAADLQRSISTPCLSLAQKIIQDELFEGAPKVEIIAGRGAPGVRALVVEVAIALASHVDPVPVSNGLGGAYLLRNRQGDNLAIAKPMDEEPLAINNPKGFVGQMLGQPGLKRSIRVGETGTRELAAYLLDHGGFVGVPPTALVKISHATFHVNNTEALSSSHADYCKIASLQRFVDHDSDAADLGPSSFSVVSVHRIGILDVRLLNLDRHAGNILVKNVVDDSCTVGNTRLVPIDQGLCLPEWLDDPYFEWLHWPQASVPFSEAETEYISNLDPFKDAELLRTELPSLQESSIRILVLCTIFLKRATSAGLCLSEIGEMMTRESCSGEDQLSMLENACAQAKVNMDEASGIADSYQEGEDIHNDDGGGGDDDDADDTAMFVFDQEFEDKKSNFVLSDLPPLLQSSLEVGKPPKIPRLASTRLTGVLSEVMLPSMQNQYNPKEDEQAKNCDTNMTKGNGGSSCGDHKVASLTKSMSFAVASYNHEVGGICLGDMSPREWECFLVMFEKVLPQAFGSVKSIRLKQRLGSSCEF